MTSVNGNNFNTEFANSPMARLTAGNLVSHNQHCTQRNTHNSTISLTFPSSRTQQPTPTANPIPHAIISSSRIINNTNNNNNNNSKITTQITTMPMIMEQKCEDIDETDDEIHERIQNNSNNNKSLNNRKLQKKRISTKPLSTIRHKNKRNAQKTDDCDSIMDKKMLNS